MLILWVLDMYFTCILHVKYKLISNVFELVGQLPLLGGVSAVYPY